MDEEKKPDSKLTPQDAYKAGRLMQGTPLEWAVSLNPHVTELTVAVFRGVHEKGMPMVAQYRPGSDLAGEAGPAGWDELRWIDGPLMAPRNPLSLPFGTGKMEVRLPGGIIVRTHEPVMVQMQDKQEWPGILVGSVSWHEGSDEMHVDVRLEHLPGPLSVPASAVRPRFPLKDEDAIPAAVQVVALQGLEKALGDDPVMGPQLRRHITKLEGRIDGQTVRITVPAPAEVVSLTPPPSKVQLEFWVVNGSPLRAVEIEEKDLLYKLDVDRELWTAIQKASDNMTTNMAGDGDRISILFETDSLLAMLAVYGISNAKLVVAVAEWVSGDVEILGPGPWHRDA